MSGSEQRRQVKEVGIKLMAERQWKSSETPNVTIGHVVDRHRAQDGYNMFSVEKEGRTRQAGTIMVAGTSSGEVKNDVVP